MTKWAVPLLDGLPPRCEAHDKLDYGDQGDRARKATKKK